MSSGPPTSVLRALAISAASASMGCIGIPPLQAGGGVASTTKADDTTIAGQLHGSVRPLAAMKSMRDRPVDIGAGAFADHRDDDTISEAERWRVGPSVDVDGYPYRSVSEDAAVRVVAGGEFRVLYQPVRDVWGPFGAARIGAEVAGQVEGCAGSSDGGLSFACGLGEGGIGAYIEGSVGRLDGQTIGSVAFTIEFRIPTGFVGGIPLPG